MMPVNKGYERFVFAKNGIIPPSFLFVKIFLKALKV